MNSEPPAEGPKVRPPKWVNLSAQLLLDAAPDGMLVVNQAGIIVGANLQAENLFGYTCAQLIGKSVEMLVPPRLRVHHSKHRENFFGDPRVRPMGVGLELFAQRDNGMEIPVDVSLSPVVIDSETFVITSIRDATERRRMEELKRTATVLRESEQRFRLVANTVPVMIWMSGPDKLFNYFNQSWIEFTGRQLGNELGNGWLEGVHPEDLGRCLDTYTQAFDRRQSFRMEYRLRRHDGEYRWILDTGVPRHSTDGSFAGYIGSRVDVDDRKKGEEAIFAMGGRLIEAHEEERRCIARELHDDIGQRLALLAVDLQSCSDIPPESPAQSRDRMQELLKRTQEIAGDVQALSHQLHSSKLEMLGIVAAAQSFCRELSAQRNVKIDFDHSNVPRAVPQAVSLCLFRVLQEALHNAAKHSGVRHFRAELRGTSSQLELTVSDSGVGFDHQKAANSPGLGLVSMRERVTLVKGTISIASNPKGGTEVRVVVPVAVCTEAKEMSASG